ncbi:PE family protein, partial [Mycobacterium bohemicum]
GVGSLLGGLGGVAPVGSMLGGVAPVGSMLGGLGGGSLVSNINGVVAALQSGNGLSLLSGSIGAGLQTLSRDIAALPTTLQSYGNALAPSLLPAGASTGGVTGPYQTLFDNTVANLETLGGAISANPAPLLHQLITNATGYANTIAGDLQYLLQNFPTVLANLPANVQAAFQALLAFNPAPYIQQFINNQMTFANMWATALQGAGQSFVTGLQALPAAFQSAFQELLTGNIGGALADVTGGFLNLFVTGVNVATTGSVTTPPGVTATITPTGTVEDLLPLLTIPGMRAQNLTNLLPSGSIASQVAQNATNVIQTVTDTSLVAQALLSVRIFPPSATLSVNLTAGLPVALGLDAIGAPINALDAASAGASQLIGQLQTGNSLGAISTLVDGPAYVGDAFLNGQSTMPIQFDISGLPATVNLPLNGILVPQTGYTASVNTAIGTVTSPVGGTPLSGLATALLVYAPEQLASAITPGM